jgi:hypothetical protein
MSPTLPVIDETTWRRMSWHAQQQWLQTAAKLRRELITDITHRLGLEAARAERQRIFDETSDEMQRARQILASLPIDPQGRKRLHALGEAIARTDGQRRQNGSAA